MTRPSISKYARRAAVLFALLTAAGLLAAAVLRAARPEDNDRIVNGAYAIGVIGSILFTIAFIVHLRTRPLQFAVISDRDAPIEWVSGPTGYERVAEAIIRSRRAALPCPHQPALAVREEAGPLRLEIGK